MGGVGKTTLAQMVYNDTKVKDYFDLWIWICVSDDFDEMEIIKQILESIHYSSNEKGESIKFKNQNVVDRNCMNLDVLRNELVEKLKGKKYFLVLDDVWNENHWNWERIANGLKIDDGNKGSKVLVTTRKMMVANIVSSLEPIQLDGLSDDVLWHLFKTFAFGSMQKNPVELEEILKKIMSKLKGSPLAAKTVGYILRSNPNKRYWEHIESSEIWTLKQNDEGITPALMLSYRNLPEYLKPCFAFCSLYPKDYVYEKKQMVRMWIALGYIQEESERRVMEDLGEGYVKELLDSSMFQPCREYDVQHVYIADDKERFKIHDLIHDVAKLVSTKESLMIHDKGTMEHLSPCIQNLSICIDNEKWIWEGHDSFDDLNNVRTLIFLSKTGWRIDVEGGLDSFLQKALPKMKFLRVLDFRGVVNEISSLPKLKHLRYLNVNVSTFDKLASSLACLYQLQVLEIREVGIGSPRRSCLYQIRYLENLRHISGFIFDTNEDPYIEKFHFLQELELKLSVSKQSKLFLIKEKGQHRLKALRAMKWMRELRIRGLEKVQSKEEAMEADLKGMDRLTELTLAWYPRTPTAGNVEEILEALHPGPNVSVLKIEGYGGAECPGWMESLTLLRELKVTSCSNMKFIRTSGLKSIKRLEFDSCEHLRVQDGFEGFGALNTLEELSIYGCSQLIADLFTEGRGGLPYSLKEISLYLRGTSIINVSTAVMQSLTNLTSLSIAKESPDSGCFLAPSPINSTQAQQLPFLFWIIRHGNGGCTYQLCLP